MIKNQMRELKISNGINNKKNVYLLQTRSLSPISQQRHRNSSSVDRLKSPGGISSANSLSSGILARSTPPEKRMSPLPQPPETKKMKKEEVSYIQWLICFP